MAMILQKCVLSMLFKLFLGHRCLKLSACHDRTFLGYGALDDTQTGQALETNLKLTKAMTEIYGTTPAKKKGGGRRR